MKRLALFMITVLAVFTLIPHRVMAQKKTEVIQPLTKEARKGYIDDVTFDADGTMHVIYQQKIEKKKDEIAYQDYTFSKDLKFIENKATTVAKEVKPDKEIKRLGAYVGACSSFDILSMNLRVATEKVKLYNWNYKKQRYDKSKVLESETVKIRNDQGKKYKGVEKYWNEDANKLTILAYAETKDKANPKQYSLLTIDFDGNVMEKPFDVAGRYSMVYSQEIGESEGKQVGKQDFIVILAPKKGSPDINEYIYLHYDINGNLKNKVPFHSPSSNLLIHNATVIDGSVYLFGQSTNSKDAYEQVFEDYAPIENPCYTGAENYQMDKYNKAAKEDMDNFHVLKFTGNKLDLATTSPIKDLKAKMKTAPSEKGATPYKGKKFVITKFEVTLANEFLIAGQLVSRVNIGNLKNPVYVPAYGDIVCLHLDANGNLKAQYAVDKMFEGKMSSLTPMPQSFYFSPDGKSVYWEILESKADKDHDWLTGANSWSLQFYPRVTKINLENLSMSDFTVFGGKKFFVYNSFVGKYFQEQGYMIYVGKDDDEDNLWVGKLVFE